MTASIELRHVSKRYDGVTAVDDLSFEVAPGRIFGLLGPNGAGKTSTLRMMLGIMLADSGTVRMFGEELGRRNLRRAGYLPEERGLYGKMTVRENLSFFAQLSGLDGGQAGRKAQAWCERLGIHDRLDSKVDELSKGMQQKIQFAAAVIHDPEFIVMDEPFTGLDPVNVNELKNVLIEFRAQGRTIVFSTHRMDQVEQLCDSICLIDRGRCVVQGGVREIKSRYRANCVEIDCDGDGNFLESSPLVDSWKRHSGFIEVRLSAGADPQALLRIAAAGSTVRRFEIKEPSVEQIFIDLIGKRDDGA
ncbi:MAG TPA: ATP-binding cassette domain-containing protein [Pseudomonadota bacterium]|nr:ATP-binding cassette domain-containing protein [Pseudomonadota bacterium]